MPLFSVPHKRPTHLSDPFHDYGEGWLQGLIQTPDAVLKWSDFQALFGPILPAGTYEEVIYFLPLAFDFILSDKKSASEVINPVIGFISKNVANLQNDGILEPCRSAITHCLRRWTTDFQVLAEPTKVDTTGADWRKPHLGDVKNSGNVSDTLACLTKYKTQADIAQQFIADLIASSHQPVPASWFLEVASQQERCLRFDKIKDENVLALLQNRHNLKTAADTIYAHDIKNNLNINHWTAVFYILGL